MSVVKIGGLCSALGFEIHNWLHSLLSVVKEATSQNEETNTHHDCYDDNPQSDQLVITIFFLDSSGAIILFFRC